MVTVFGLGFVGLTTALGFADKGIRVFGVDADTERLAQIEDGSVPFYEPHLDNVLAKTLQKTFSVSDDVKKAVKASRIIFYCVGTPYGKDGSADLTQLFNAIGTTIDSIEDDIFRVLVVKSTVPPSTTAERILPFIKSKNANVGLANNPEFLREGYCWDDFTNPDRIVLGCADEKSEKSRAMLEQLYEPFNAPVITVDYNTAEFIKYLSNTLLATMISYSNEMALIAGNIGDIDIKQAFKTLHMDKRWGGCDMTSYVYPGCGYGGYCLPKDTNALLSVAQQKGSTPKILSEVISLNNQMPLHIADKITKGLAKTERIGILGLSFKPGSDDVRDTPAAKIIAELLKRGYKNIAAHDPVAIPEFQKHYDFEIEYCAQLSELDAKVCAIITAWDEYKNMSLPGEVVDCRYCLW